MNREDKLKEILDHRSIDRVSSLTDTRRVHAALDKEVQKRSRYLRIKTWKEDRLNDTFAAMVMRAKEMNLAVDLKNDVLFSPEHGQMLNRNMFRSLMRHDLAEHFDGLPPKDRNRMIDAMFDGFIKGSHALEKEGSHPELFVDLETMNDMRIDTGDSQSPPVSGQEDGVRGHGIQLGEQSECGPGMCLPAVS